MAWVCTDSGEIYQQFIRSQNQAYLNQDSKLFSNGINMVVSNNCAVMMKMSGFKSTFPAGGINLLKNRSIGPVRLLSIGAICVCGFIQLSKA